MTLNSATEWTGALSPITVPGTVDGTAYFFTVKADNTVADVFTGLGVTSVSLSGTAFHRPDPPTGVYGISADSQVAVTWVAPTDTGGASVVITHYVIYTTPAIGSMCGDIGDAATCGALSNEMVCNGVSQCAWDATDVDAAFCSVKCSMVVLSAAVTGTVTGLTNGVWYRFYVTAKNVYGESDVSEWPGNCAPASGTAGSAVTEATCVATAGNTWYDSTGPHGGVAPGSVPGAPFVTGAATHPSGEATIVSFSAPVDSGGHTITGYTVYAWSNTGATTPPGGMTLNSATEWTGALSPITVPGTVDGTAYFFTVKADNTVADVSTGASAASASLGLTSMKAPDAPTGVYGVSGESSVVLTWVAPVDVGGSAVTHYAIYTTPAVDSSCGNVGDIPTCEALSTAYSCDANSACSWDSTASTTAHCTVRCSMIVDVAAVTGTVTGLTNGVWYRFYVTATNVAGTSKVSAWSGNCAAASGTASTAVTKAGCEVTTGSIWYDAYDPYGGVAPGTVSLSPTVSSVVSHPAGGATIVSFQGPNDNGGHTVTGYTVYAYAAVTLGTHLKIMGEEKWSGALSPITVPGTVDGTSYWFTVVADNTVSDVLTGLSAESSALTGAAGKPPDAPTGVYGVSADSQVAVTWVAPADTGGIGVTLRYYTIYTTPPIGDYCGDQGHASMCYALAGEMMCDANTRCAWDASVSSYGFCSVKCCVSVAAAAVTGTVMGLTNGVWYRFTVTATNDFATGPHSVWPGDCVGGTQADEVTCVAAGKIWIAATAVHGGAAPGSVPGQPEGVSTARHLDGNAVIVSFKRPMDDGGLSITGYNVYTYLSSSTPPSNKLTIGGQAAWTGSGSPITVPVTAEGNTYKFTVAAVNTMTDVSSGEGAESAPALGTSSHVPDSPTAVGGISADSQVAVTWDAPVDTGSSTILYYTVWPDPLPHELCGDQSYEASCLAISTQSGCDQVSKCSWDMTITSNHHCSVRCTTIAASTSATVISLTNGVWYRFTVTASNANGPSKHFVWEGNCVGNTARTQNGCVSASSTWIDGHTARGAVAPGAAPDPPTITSVTPINSGGSVTVVFTSVTDPGTGPMDSGGHTIHTYRVYAYTDATNAATGSSAAIGKCSDSHYDTSATCVTTSACTAQNGNQVNCNAIATCTHDGSSTCSPTFTWTMWSATDVQSPLVVPGLTNGMQYWFRVTADNTVADVNTGEGAQSIVAVAATPLTVPGQPTVHGECSADGYSRYAQCTTTGSGTWTDDLVPSDSQVAVTYAMPGAQYIVHVSVDTDFANHVSWQIDSGDVYGPYTVSGDHYETIYLSGGAHTLRYADDAIDESCTATYASTCAAADLTGSAANGLTKCNDAGDCTYTAGSAITAGAITSMDALTYNTVTLQNLESSIVAGQKLQLADASGQTCVALPKATDLTVASVDGRIITFTTDITRGDSAGNSQCVITRAIEETDSCAAADASACGAAVISGDVATSTTNCKAAGQCIYRSGNTGGWHASYVRISGPNYVGGTYLASGIGDDPFLQGAVSPTNAGTTVFTVPTNTGGSPITHYIATATPGGITDGAITSIESNGVGEGYTTGTHGDQNMMVTNNVHSDLAAGDKIRIIDKPGQTCTVAPLGSDLTIGTVTHGERRSSIKFTTDITATDASAAANCIFTRNSAIVMAYDATVSAVDDTAETATLAAAEDAVIVGSTLQLTDRGGTTAAAIVAGAVASIDAGGANTVTLASADATILAGQTLQLADASSQTCLATPKTTDLVVASVAIAIAAAATASIDAGTANSVTLGGTDGTIVAGQRLQLADASSQTCTATPKGSDLVVLSVNGAVITFSTDITAGDGSASTNCVITRGTTITFTTDLSLGDGSASTNCVITRPAPCAAAPKGSALVVSAVSGTTVTFSTDITATDAAAATNCVLKAADNTITVPGLDNGAAYAFTTVARSSVGYSDNNVHGGVIGAYLGNASTISSPTTPGKVPDPPRITGLSAASTTATVTFQSPADTGGASIVLYTVTASPGGVTQTGVLSPIVVTGLTNGVEYSFSVRAHSHWGYSAAGLVSTYSTLNSVLSGGETGSGSCCCESNTVLGDGSREDCIGTGLSWYTTVTPSMLPDPPVVTAVTASHGGAVVAFTAPADNGGSAITAYTVSAITGSTATGETVGLITATGSTSPIVVTGLSSGVAYTVTVTATNAKGTSGAAWTSSGTAAAIGGAILTAIDAGTANTVSLASGDSTVVKDQKLRILDRSGTTSSAIAAAATASIDAGTANSVTLGGTDGTIVAGQRLQLADASSQTCTATPKGSDLVVLSVNGAVITFSTDITAGDGSASTNCVITRAAPCAATPKDTDLTVSVVSSDSKTLTFATDITLGDASAATSCVIGRAVANGVTPDVTPTVAPLITAVVGGTNQAVVHFDPPTECTTSTTMATSCSAWTFKVEAYTGSGSLVTSATGATTPVTVTGLSSSVNYQFKAYAVNSISEESPASASSPQVTVS